MATGQALGGAGVDALSEVENLTGSAFADELYGDSAANSISGGNGDDILGGGAGNDTLDGGSGLDSVSYAAATGAVVVNLSTLSAVSVSEGTDTLISIENVTGSNYNDARTGDGAVNTLNAGAGDDTLSGGAGNDILNGETGIDTVTYASAAAAQQPPHSVGKHQYRIVEHQQRTALQQRDPVRAPAQDGCHARALAR